MASAARILFGSPRQVKANALIASMAKVSLSGFLRVSLSESIVGSLKVVSRNKLSALTDHLRLKLFFETGFSHELIRNNMPAKAMSFLIFKYNGNVNSTQIMI